MMRQNCGRNLRKIHLKYNWTRLESWASFGVPDLLGYHNTCGFFMVELKIATRSKNIIFSPSKTISL
jgi:phosphatidylserine decarboxylase